MIFANISQCRKFLLFSVITGKIRKITKLIIKLIYTMKELSHFYCHKFIYHFNLDRVILTLMLPEMFK